MNRNWKKKQLAILICVYIIECLIIKVICVCTHTCMWHVYVFFTTLDEFSVKDNEKASYWKKIIVTFAWLFSMPRFYSSSYI